MSADDRIWIRCNECKKGITLWKAYGYSKGHVVYSGDDYEQFIKSHLAVCHGYVKDSEKPQDMVAWKDINVLPVDRAFDLAYESHNDEINAWPDSPGDVCSVCYGRLTIGDKAPCFACGGHGVIQDCTEAHDNPT